MSNEQHQVLGLTYFGTIVDDGDWKPFTTYNYVAGSRVPLVTYEDMSYIAISEPDEVTPDKSTHWKPIAKNSAGSSVVIDGKVVKKLKAGANVNLVDKGDGVFEIQANGGGSKPDVTEPLAYDTQDKLGLLYDSYLFKVAPKPEDTAEPPEGALTFSDEFAEDLNTAIDDAYMEGYHAQLAADAAMEIAQKANNQANLAIQEIKDVNLDLKDVRTTANTAKTTADSAVKKVSAKDSDTIKFKVTELSNKEFQISGDVTSSSPGNKIALYNFVYGKGYNIVYDKAVIPSVSVVSVKDKIPSKELSISVTYILDSFYPDSAKYLVVCVNLGKTTVKIKGTDTVVSKDLLFYKRFSIEVKTPTKALFVDTDYVSFKFDPTVIFANPELCNFNQELINITASSYEAAGYIDNYPVWIDDTNPSGTSWSKMGKAGTGGLITLANQSYFYYDGRQVNAGNLVVDFTIDMQRNIFTNGFTKYLVFKGETTEALPSHKLKIIIKANSDTNIQSNVPYSILNKKEVAFVFDMSNAKDNIRNQVAVTLVCTNNSLILTAFQFAESSVKLAVTNYKNQDNKLTQLIDFIQPITPVNVYDKAVELQQVLDDSLSHDEFANQVVSICEHPDEMFAEINADTIYTALKTATF